MNKGFTLIELLVVVGIMGLLGTVSVGGYQQMKRGMEESHIVDNVSKFINLAAERAEIERRPIAVYYWNELVREESDTESMIVVGRAVAIRQCGRISRVVGKWLADEYGDLEQIDGDVFAEAPSKHLPSRLYLLDDLTDGVFYSNVRDVPQTYDGKADTGQVEVYVTTDPKYNQNDVLIAGNNTAYTKTKDGKLIQYGYYIMDYKTANADKWKVGSAYGVEFQSLELPHNYIFGSTYPKSISKPISGEGTIVFDATKTISKGGSTSSGSATVRISVLKPGDSGTITAVSLGSTKVPDIQLNW